MGKKGKKSTIERLKMFKEKRKNEVSGEEEQASPKQTEKEEKICITMLGASASGKTTFLSGVYQSLMLDFDTDLHLEINPAYNNRENYANIEDTAIYKHKDGNNSFPPGTAETKWYGLSLCGRKGGKRRKYCDFEFMDYRGSLVDEIRKEGQNEKDAELLRRQLLKSDCILIFLDAVKISQYEETAVRSQQCGYGQIYQILSEFLKGWEQNKNVIVVLTRIDDEFVKPKDKESDYLGLCEKAWEICTNIRKASHTFCIIPVSAVGEGKTSSEAVRGADGGMVWTSKLKKGAVPEPVNIDITVLYACRRILDGKASALEQEIRALEEEQGKLLEDKRPKPDTKLHYQELGEQILEKEEQNRAYRESIKDIDDKKLEQFMRFIRHEGVRE